MSEISFFLLQINYNDFNLKRPCVNFFNFFLNFVNSYTQYIHDESMHTDRNLMKNYIKKRRGLSLLFHFLSFEKFKLYRKYGSNKQYSDNSVQLSEYARRTHRCLNPNLLPSCAAAPNTLPSSAAILWAPPLSAPSRLGLIFSAVGESPTLP
jgi:hypothetical protein